MNTEERKQFLESSEIHDYLTEDPPVYNQKYFVLSYFLPSSKNELDFPIFKMRGAFNTVEECENRIKKLKNIDTYFNMYICEVGKFGSLLSDSELLKNDQIDVEYRDSRLNDIVKSYKENKDKVDNEYESRKQRLSKLASFEGTKEGQDILSNKKENPISVKTRVETLSAHLEDLNLKIKEVSEIVKTSKKQLENDYTEEELKAAEDEMKKTEIEIKNFKPETEPIASMFAKDDPFILRKNKNQI